MPVSKKRKKPAPARRKPRPGVRRAPGDGVVPGFSNDERLGLESIFAQLIRGAGRELSPRLSPLDVHLWASSVWGVWYGRELIGQDTEAVFGGGLIRHAATSRSPASVRVLRALAAVAPVPYGGRAATEAVKLIAAGHAEAPWADAVTAPVEARGAAINEDPVDDDGVAVMVGFDGAVGAHTIGVFVDFNLGGIAKDAFCVPAPLDEVVERLERRMAEEPQNETVIRSIEGAEAAARWRAAIETTDMTFHPPIDPSMRSLRALVLARGVSLGASGRVPAPPEISARERDEILKDFEGSSFAAELADAGVGPQRAGDLGFHCMTYALDYAAGTPLRFSPVMVEIFCCDWAPRKVVGVTDDFKAMPDVLRAWIRFAGHRRGIPQPRIEGAISAVKKHERALRAAAMDPKAWGPAKAMMQTMLARGGDPTDKRELEAFIEQINSGEIEVALP